MATDTLRDIAIEKAPTQEVLIDLLTEESPFLDRLPMEAASDGNINKFEKITDITSAQVVELDEALPVVNSNTEIDQTTISRIGGIIHAPKNKVDLCFYSLFYVACFIPCQDKQQQNIWSSS